MLFFSIPFSLWLTFLDHNGRRDMTINAPEHIFQSDEEMEENANEGHVGHHLIAGCLPSCVQQN